MRNKLKFWWLAGFMDNRDPVGKIIFYFLCMIILSALWVAIFYWLTGHLAGSIIVGSLAGVVGTILLAVITG